MNIRLACFTAARRLSCSTQIRLDDPRSTFNVATRAWLLWADASISVGFHPYPRRNSHPCCGEDTQVASSLPPCVLQARSKLVHTGEAPARLDRPIRKTAPTVPVVEREWLDRAV